MEILYCIIHQNINISLTMRYLVLYTMKPEMTNRIRVPVQPRGMPDIQKFEQIFQEWNGDKVEYFIQAISALK